jgi:[ribosomal protein S18]-alanine N-acetyltransferase
MPPAIIRHPSARDLDALVEIYITCFPDRVQAVFGGAHRRVFIADYLRFYLTWDPANVWVYGSDNDILGVVIAPRDYAPLRAALSGGQIFSWLWHGLTGHYGFPLHILKLFLRSGFAFNNDPAIYELWGKPYIHLFAVAPGSQGQGIGSRLLAWTLEQYRQQGVECCWLMVQQDNHGGMAFYQKFGFRMYKPIANGDLVMIWGDPHAALRHRERR